VKPTQNRDTGWPCLPPPPPVGSGGGRGAALQALKKAKCPYAAAPFTAAAFPEVYRALFDGTA